MTYGAKTIAVTTRTKRLLRTTEMRTIHNMTTGNTLMNRNRNVQLRQKTDINDINKWIRQHRRRWSGHVGRMLENRLPQMQETTFSMVEDLSPKRWRNSWQSISQNQH